VLVACDQPTAYRLFVDDIGTWWPLASFGCFRDGGSVAFEADEIVETSASGETAVWGTVIEAEPPNVLAFTWHPGIDPAKATRVTVTFTATGSADATLVTLVHTGWEAYADPTAARDNYAGGWITVLDRYAAAPSAGSSSGELWLVLAHTAGPAAPPGGVFASPDFPRHIQFLKSLQENGTLVAGGPLPDTAGEGMTVVRAINVDQARRVVAAAQHEDGSVTSGLLDVRVRPWRVAMTGA
jgi:uncharacterized protein YndB with AHSA1/START domain/uncharacterized protein YciI